MSAIAHGLFVSAYPSPKLINREDRSFSLGRQATRPHVWAEVQRGDKQDCACVDRLLSSALLTSQAEPPKQSARNQLNSRSQA